MNGKVSDEEPDETIKKLILLVDDEWKKLGLFEQMKPVLPQLIGGIISIVVIFLIVYLVLTLATLLANIETLLTVAIAALALAWSSVSFFYSLTKPEDRESEICRTIDYNCERLKKQKVDTTRTLIDRHPFLLKALIRMRTLQPDFKLGKVYKNHPFLFNEENLVRSLYD